MTKHLEESLAKVLICLAQDFLDRRLVAVEDLQRALFDRDVVCDAKGIESLLDVLVSRGLVYRDHASNGYAATCKGFCEAKLATAPTFRSVAESADRYMDNLSAAGVAAVAAGAPASTANQIVEAEHRERMMTLCVSERAIDEWWQQLDGEMKADVFTTFLESCAEGKV